MKQASARDVWRKVKKKNNWRIYIKALRFYNVKNINIGTIAFKPGINAICGANGVGKSTILNSINLGLDSKYTSDEDFFKESQIEIDLFVEGQEYTYQRDFRENVTNFPDIEISCLGLRGSAECMERFRKEKNIEEYLENTEEQILQAKQLEQISSILGKSYTRCSVYAVEETNEYGEMPFFVVEANGLMYDSRSMGLGEHAVIYNYFYIWNISRGVILIEEPENFIPPFSQTLFIRCLAEISIKNDLNIVISTHSEHILNELPDEYIHIIRNIGQGVIITTVDSRNDYSRPLGLERKIEGYILVEDYIARLFAQSLFKYLFAEEYHKYIFISVDGGESIIASTLKTYKDTKYKFNIIGMFDGDMNNESKKKEIGITEFKWKHMFLPFLVAPEDIFKEVVYSERSKEVCEKLAINQIEFEVAKADTLRYEKHDWLHEFYKECKINVERFIDVLTEILIADENNIATIEEFIEVVRNTLN